MLSRYFSINLALFMFVVTVKANDYLFVNGRSLYSIVLPPDATETEKTAASELQAVIKRMSGADVPITTTPAGKNIFVGWSSRLGVAKPDAADESYTYKTVDGNLYIYGGSQRGTMYGVYAFLEREMGVRWYTSSYTKIPSVSVFRLDSLNHTESPAFRQRLDFCYDALRHNEWVARNLLNSQDGIQKSNYGKMQAYWGTHSFRRLIPPSDYFHQHPEFFSQIKGRRVDNAQLCLSNEDMRRELVKNLKGVMTRMPDYWCYDVSQNDNMSPCECADCQRLVKKYGGQSGIMIWFVNQVAREIKRTFPDKYIGTFAYHYTRQAPKSNIKPDDNVVVRLCNIECCMAHPLEQCKLNCSFLKDMDDWKKITQNIYVWDYTTGFHHYLLPFPNFETMASNYRYFKRSNVMGVLEEGAYDAPWNEFSELKQWLIAKLLWNPDLNVDSLATVFINDYYGAAAPYVKQYYDLCNAQITNNTHFTIHVDGKSDLYSDRFVKEGMALMSKALAVVDKDGEEYLRVRRIAAQVYYLKACRNKVKSLADDACRQLTDIIANDPTIVAERGRKLEKMLKVLGYE